MKRDQVLKFWPASARMVAAWAALAVGTAFGDANWTGANGTNLDDASNWSATPSGMLYLKTNGGYYTLGADQVDLFGGVVGLRYNGGSQTNDFGAGHAITNLGVNAASAFHVEGGCKLTQKSGGIVAYKGTQYDAAYITDNSTYCLDGPDSFFDCSRSAINLRSNSAYEGKGFTYPTLIVTNGATLKTATLATGAGSSRSSAVVVVAGTGSTMQISGSLLNGTSTDSSVPSTNRVVVTDGAYLQARHLNAGHNRTGAQFEVSHGAAAVSTDSFRVGNSDNISNCTARIVAGGILTNQAYTYVGSSVNGKGGHLLQVSGTNSLVKAGGPVTVYTKSTLRVEDAAVLDVSSPHALSIYGETIIDHGFLNVTTNFVLSGGSWVANDALVSNQVTTAWSGSAFHATNVSYNLTGDFTVGGNVKAVLKNSTLNYGRIMLGSSNGSLTLEDCVANGARVEMGGSNTTVRLINTQLTVKSASASIFMLGDGSGGEEASNARERHVYVGGSNTWVKTLWSTYGLFVRGSNTTIHVEIPATGFSKEHPVFDLTNLAFQNGNSAWILKVDVSVDRELPLRGGGTYTLFKGSNVQDSRVRYTYDPEIVSIDKSVANEVRIHVKCLSGTLIQVR